MATSTPWGTAQQSHQLAPGIMQYYTAGHGGIHLSQGRLKGLPPEFLGWDGKNGQGGWYEEDCEAAKGLLWFGIVCDHWADPAARRQAVKNNVKQWNPEAWALWVGLHPEDK